MSSPIPDGSSESSPVDASTPSPSVVTLPGAAASTTAPTSSSVLSTHTHSVTGTPLPADTPSPSTVTPEEERAFVKEMLVTNGGCELPCWWGIAPGEDDWQSAVDFLRVHGGFQLIVLSSDDVYEYEVLHTLAEGDGKVQSIKVVGSTKWESPSESFAQDLSRYSLDRVLARYGTPSRVRVVLNEYGGGGGPFYALLVFYDEAGVGIRYHGHALRENGLFRVCFSFSDITLWLQSPKASMPLHMNVDPDEWLYSVPLHEATGMSAEEFRETFQQPGVCLEAQETTP
jgi:hypothetical protein